MNYSTSFCPFESGKSGKGKKLQKLEYLEKHFSLFFEELPFGEKIKI